MRAIDISSLRNGFKGTQFRELVAHHLRRQSQRERARALQGTIALLPEKFRSIPEGFIDRWNARIHDPALWERDTADVFDEITADARNALRHFGHDKDDEAAFNLFNIVVMNYAYNAGLHPEMRTMLGVGGSSFPFASAICLLYPIAATIHMSRTPAKGTEIAGYGIANLAYLLFAAGIFAGSFRVFGLGSRKTVIGAAVLAFVVGVVLTNIA
jgi:hypothetical protein